SSALINSVFSNRKSALPQDNFDASGKSPEIRTIPAASRSRSKRERGWSNKPPKGGGALGGNTIMYGTGRALSISAASSGLSQLAFLQFRGRLAAALDLHFHAVVAREPGSGRDQPAHDHVFLESNQAIDLAVNCRLGQYPGGLLERRRRDEALGREARLGD